MSLTVPFINTIPAINASISQDNIVNVNILGGDAITRYWYYIYNQNDYNTPIYTSQIFNVTNDVANGSIRSYPMTINPVVCNMQNNNSYLICCEVSNNSDSIVSNYQNIICYNTPNIQLKYINSLGNLVPLTQNSTLSYQIAELSIYYDNNDLNSPAEPNSCQVILYGIDFSGNKNLITELNNIYNFDYDNNNQIYTKDIELKGFIINVDNNGNYLTINETPYQYYEIKLILSTIENMVIERTYTKINCFYNVLLNSNKVILNNLCQKGSVEIDVKLTSIKGTSNVPLSYIGSEEVNLTNSNNWAKWQEVFILSQPYTIRIWGRNFNIGTILESTNTIYMGKYLKINYNQDNSYTFISLECGESLDNGTPMFPYYIESQRILTSSINENTNLFIGIQQQNNMFDIDFEIIT